MHARTLVASLTPFLLSACTTVTPPPAPTALADPVATAAVEEVATNVTTATVVCQSEVLTPSRIPQRTCRERSQAELEKARAEATTKQLSQQPRHIGGDYKPTSR